ncbi:MAG: hypothetical protein OES38_07510 [Gammaproteobacteria bacterium]|nr:hypothetical protein [Gammaproteobacteria bacterium]
MKTRHLLLLTLLTVCTTSGYAAEADPEQEPKEAVSADKPAAGTRTKPTPEIFVPTEEISEDFAVSFPVDI